MIVSTGLVILLASCGTIGATDGQVEQEIVKTATLPPTVAPPPTPVVALTADDVQRITPIEAKALLDNGTAALYDARSAGEYRTQHAAGAISFPETDVTARIGELPTDKALIFYCT
ncbi:MAG: rhodanese-like domain-containing protein [Anaerolineae bacterium]